jgi:hypothetical protein
MADDEFVTIEEGGGGDSSPDGGDDDVTVDDFGDDQAGDEGEITPGEYGFATDEGEEFVAGEPPDPTVPPDPLDSLPPVDPLGAVPPGFDGPSLVAGTPADDARAEYGDLDEDAIRELLNTPELTSEERDELQDLLREQQAGNAQDRIEMRTDPEGDGDIEEVPVD